MKEASNHPMLITG